MLLIDIGNSRIKWTLWYQGRLTDVQASEYHEHWDAHDYWLHINQSLKHHFDLVAICSVRPNFTKTLIDTAPCKVIEALSERQFGGLINSYKEPSKMGNDRWVAMLGASKLGKEAVLVIDAGTAITYDWVNDKGLHLGGFIIPGLLQQKSILLGSTERVTAQHEWHIDIDPGTETSNCVQHGLFAQILGVVLTQKERLEMTGIRRIVITGGDADIVFELFKEHFRAENIQIEIDKTLIFKGLVLYVNNIEKN